MNEKEQLPMTENKDISGKSKDIPKRTDRACRVERL